MFGRDAVRRCPIIALLYVEETVTRLLAFLNLWKNPYSGLFRGWKKGTYTTKSPDGNYELWTANGPLFFRDYASQRQLITTLPYIDRVLVWRALHDDMAKDSRRRLEELRNG